MPHPKIARFPIPLRTALAGSALVACLLAAGPAAGGTIRVPRGATLSSIAVVQRTTVARLARLNHLDPDGLLLAGSRLRVPGNAAGGSSSSYRVRPGDSLSSIAARFGTTIASLAAQNRLRPNAILPVGRRLRVGRHTTVSGVEQSAAGRILASSGDVQAAIDFWSAHYRVDRHLARAIAWQESGYQPGLVSSAGARGVMQVLPATRSYVELLIGHPVPQSVDGNIRVGVAYLHHLLNHFGGDERLAVAGYYQGAGGLRRGRVLPETRPYVRAVLALRNRL